MPASGPRRSRAPVHTPYDGSVKPFAIGVKPLDPQAWIEVDEHLDRYLAEKDRLHAARPEAVFREAMDVSGSVAELGELLLEHLSGQHARTHGISGRQVRLKRSGRLIDLDDRRLRPLWQLARLVQEDLCLMRRFDDGWRLAAAALAFPSSWTLADKIGRPMEAIHDPVPGFAGRMATVVTRIFDNLAVDRPVWRMNWSLYDDAELFHAAPHGDGHWRFAETIEPDGIQLRVERQTLRRLPVSGDIVFTIRIHVDPLASLEDHPDGRAILFSLADELDDHDPAMLAYKGLTRDRPRMVEAIRDLAARLPDPPRP